MKTARSGSSPSPSTSRSASKLCSWRPKALRAAVASIRPRWSRSQTIIPAQVPRIGRPARVVGADRRLQARRARSPSRSSCSRRRGSPARRGPRGRPGVRTSRASAPSCAQHPRVRLEVALDREDADLQRGCSGTAVLQQGVVGRERRRSRGPASPRRARSRPRRPARGR